MTVEQAKENERKYPPGSDAAIAIHCTCSVFENRRGAGAYVIEDMFTGERVPHFWISGDCPVHSATEVGDGW